MFFLQRLFLFHTRHLPFTLPWLWVLIVQAAATKTLTYGWTFDWRSVWQPMVQPCDSSSAILQCQEYCCAFVRICFRWIDFLAPTPPLSAATNLPILLYKHTFISLSLFPTSSAGCRGSGYVSAASRPPSPEKWSHSCSSAAGRATPRHGWMGQYRRRRWPSGEQTNSRERQKVKQGVLFWQRGINCAHGVAKCCATESPGRETNTAYCACPAKTELLCSEEMSWSQSNCHWVISVRWRTFDWVKPRQHKWLTGGGTLAKTSLLII